MDRRKFLRLALLAPAAAVACRGSDSASQDGERARAVFRPQTQEQAPEFAHRTYVPGAVREGYPLDVRVSTEEVFQGGALLVTSNQGIGGIATLFGRTYVLEPLPDGGLQGFVGVGVLDPPGATTLTVDVNRDGDDDATFEFDLTVLATDWTVEYIYFEPDPDAPSNPLDPVEIARERELLTEVYAGVTPRKWGGSWIAPVDTRISSYFGEQRSFNDGPVGGHHGGTDFAAEEGTPFVATNSGVVVLARELVVRGNMIIVDHGGGVFSGYAHLSRIDVAEGQHVEKGDVLGAIGATGLATGAHLHWEMSVAGILVDGLRWLDGTQGF